MITDMNSLALMRYLLKLFCIDIRQLSFPNLNLDFWLIAPSSKLTVAATSKLVAVN